MQIRLAQTIFLGEECFLKKSSSCSQVVLKMLKGDKMRKYIYAFKEVLLHQVTHSISQNSLRRLGNLMYKRLRFWHCNCRVDTLLPCKTQSITDT